MTGAVLAFLRDRSLCAWFDFNVMIRSIVAPVVKKQAKTPTTYQVWPVIGRNGTAS